MKKNTLRYSYQNIKRWIVCDITLLTCCLILFPILVQAQPLTVFIDNFDRGSTTTFPGQGGTPVVKWTAYSTLNPSAKIITWGSTGSYEGDRTLQIFGTNETADTGTPGRSYVVGPLKDFDSLFKSTLNKNEGDVTWTFNWRNIRFGATSPLTGFDLGNSNYGQAVVLVASSSNLMTANGYAVTLTGAGSTAVNERIIQIVRFENGLVSNSNITPIVTSTVGTLIGVNFSSVKVVYTPATNTWSLSHRDEGSIPKNPMNEKLGAYTFIGSAVDATYTGDPMTSCGFFYNHGIATSGSISKAMWDNFGVKVTEVKVTGDMKIYVSSKESTATKTAVESLMRDVKKTTGKYAQLIYTDDMINVPENAIVVLNNSLNEQLVPEACKLKVSGEEAHRVYRLNNRVYLHGDDMRGTIYAIYTFSENVLGVPPLWFWSSWEPEIKPEVEIPENLDIHFSSPKVRYRAWFPNDQDMLTRWRNRTADNNVSWLETMLRLKLNTVEMNSSLFYSTSGTARLNDQATLVRDYGLIISSTHTVALGTHFSNWNDYWTRIKGMSKAPEFKVQNEAQLKEFWEHAATTVHNSGAESIWQLSFRGNGDIPFWETFTDAPTTNAARAAVINKMWGYQYEILKKVTGKSDPVVKMSFYNEISDLMAAGLLTPPQTENTIWNYVATRRDHYPNTDIINFNTPVVKLGYYMNLQFTSSGSHLTQGEGPWKMEFNYRYVDSKSPLYFSVVNAGNIREFLLSMSAHARMMWDYNTYNTNDYLNEFCRTYFGDSQAVQIATLYRDYFNAYWQQKQPDFQGGMERQYIFQDLRYKQAIRDLLKNFSNSSYSANPLTRTEFRYYNIVLADNNATNHVDALINGMNHSMNSFAMVAAEADLIFQNLPESYKDFFNDNLRSQAHFMSEISKVLYHLATSYKNYWSNKSLAKTHFNDALAAAYRARDYIYTAQHSQFYDWYIGDAEGGMFNIPDMISRLESVGNETKLTNVILSPIERHFIFSIEGLKLSVIPRGQENFNLAVYNVKGQPLVSLQNLSGKTTFNYDWIQGIYFIEIISERKRFTHKLIIP